MLNAEENVFAGPLSEQYELVNLICPGLPVLRRKLGEYVAQWRPVYDGPAPLRVLEIGCGSGASAQALLTRREDLHLFALDSSAKMLKQARTNLSHWEQAGRIEFAETEALEGLARTPEGDMDVVASSYVIHNFERGYRERIHAEIYRVLKPGGLFINGDRYAIDDRAAHLAQVQKDTRYWFKTLAPMGRLEQLEEWVVHLIHDENSMHIMYLTTAIENLKTLGFRDVKVERREGVDALVTAVKPL